ncbi:MAG: hypothetical protein APF84_05775 [Gracilibacter sp. BRH_c7a]|nr:MAG: hypothetical protein APF84_05775 [Gracilibacter sp. BRH_c7a]
MLPLKSARVTYVYGVKNGRYAKVYHTGIDLASAETSVYAAVSGTILEARYAPGNGADPAGWGNYVILRTLDHRYDIINAHLADVQVSQGLTVDEGTLLGKMGSTGNSTGPHLHFEVRKTPWIDRDDIDPASFLGIYNRVGQVEKVSSTSIKNIVLCHPGPDERAAGYLADCLKAPICYLANTTQELLHLAERVYVIGSSEKAFAKTVNIVGADRYDTCRKVLDICQRE